MPTRMVAQSTEKSAANRASSLEANKAPVDTEVASSMAAIFASRSFQTSAPE